MIPIVTPIVVPIHSQREVNCIVQDGERYCEKSDLTPKELGFGLMIIATILVWIGFWMWLSIEREYDLFLCMFCAFVFPLGIVGLTLIL